jgi:TolB-like protein
MKTGLIFYLAIFSVYSGFTQINRGIIETNNVNSESKGLLPSRFHALIIAESNYNDPSITDLDNDPINDANNLSKILIQKYSFSSNNVDLLIDASRNEIIDKLELKRRELTEEDNLLIFYAGHGYWEKELNMGYWWPSDTKFQSKGSWIANTDLTTYISAIKAKHVLLISDACFSGGIFKSRGMVDMNSGLKRLYSLKSRKAITSGNLTTVPNVSVFMKYLLKKLTENEKQFLPTNELFVSIQGNILNNSNTEPLYGVIQNTDDESGEFIFYNALGTSNEINNELVKVITKKEKSVSIPVIEENNRTLSNPQRIAILGFDNTGKVSEYGDLGNPLRDMLTSDLATVKNLILVDRQSLEKVLNEQKLNNSQKFDINTATKIGKLLGAQIILTGTYFEMFGSLRIDAKFINVETGQIIFSIGSDGARGKFFDLEKDLANKIVEKLK